jgi:hypothetical protein
VFLNGFADSMHLVYITAAVLMLATFVLSFFIKEVALRSQAGLAAAASDKAMEAGQPHQVDEAGAKTETAIL